MSQAPDQRNPDQLNPYQPPKSDVSADQGQHDPTDTVLAGIHGWLIVFATSLIMAQITLGLHLNTWFNKFQTSGLTTKFAYRDPATWLLLAEFAAYVILLGAAIHLLYLLLTNKRRLLTAFPLYMVVLFVLLLGDGIVTQLSGNGFALSTELFAAPLRCLVWGVVWTLYLRRSTQARITFVR